MGGYRPECRLRADSATTTAWWLLEPREQLRQVHQHVDVEHGNAPAYCFRLVDIEVQNVLDYEEGCLIYGRSDGRIMGVRLDLGSGKVSCDPIVLLDNVTADFLTGVEAVLSANGTLAYLKGKVGESDEPDRGGERARCNPVDVARRVARVFHGELVARRDACCWGPRPMRGATSGCTTLHHVRAS